MQTGGVGSTGGRPDEFVWGGFLLEAGSHRKWDRFGNSKINNAIWEVRNNHEQRAIARDILVTHAGNEVQGRRLHELDSIGILIGPSTSSLTFDASSSESSVGKRGCGWLAC